MLGAILLMIGAGLGVIFVYAFMVYAIYLTIKREVTVIVGVMAIIVLLTLTGVFLI